MNTDPQRAGFHAAKAIGSRRGPPLPALPLVLAPAFCRGAVLRTTQVSDRLKDRGDGLVDRRAEHAADVAADRRACGVS